MKIKMLLAVCDSDYSEHLSGVLSEKYADSFDVTICSSSERLNDLLISNKYDIVLTEPSFSSYEQINAARLPIILWNDSTDIPEGVAGIKKIRKYQRISSIVGNILEAYSEICATVDAFNRGRAKITAVWSPCGGVGKTTVSLAYAARRASEGLESVYLTFENFSSVPVYFANTGKSISNAFGKQRSNISILLKGIRQKDSGSGIQYFCTPDNYDDINILSADEVEMLVSASAMEADELVIDLPSICDERVQRIFELADTIMIICDSTKSSLVKITQYMNQHNIAQRMYLKSILVNNKGSKAADIGLSKIVSLPLVQSSDPISIYKTLSGSNFEW